MRLSTFVFVFWIACGGTGTSGSSSGGRGDATSSTASGATGSPATGSTSTTGISKASASSSASGSTGGATLGTSSGGGTTAGSSSASTTGGPPFTPAAHAPFPQVPNNQGGVIASPAIVTITFAGEDADLSGFADWVVGSDWLSAVGADYGVGRGTHLAHFASDAGVGSMLDDSAIQAFLSDSAGQALPAPNADTIYVLLFPSGTSIKGPTNGISCDTFLGYHSTFSANGATFLYAVIPTCPGGESRSGFSWSVIASHEIVETATDPGGQSWILNDGPWGMLGGEVADLCVGKYFISDAGYTVQRIWSNTAAALGSTSPCIPFPAGEPYFNVTAEATSSGDGDFAASVSSSSAAQPIAFTVTPWSTAPLSFSLALSQLQGQAVTVNIPTQNGQPPVLQNGTPFTLTVNVPAGVASGSIGIALQTSDDDFATQNLAPLLISVN